MRTRIAALLEVAIARVLAGEGDLLGAREIEVVDGERHDLLAHVAEGFHEGPCQRALAAALGTGDADDERPSGELVGAEGRDALVVVGAPRVLDARADALPKLDGHGLILSLSLIHI